jgi:hypothetical protein
MSGQFHERQLARGLGNWTIHGHRSLADHLASQGLVAHEERAKLENEAIEWLTESRDLKGDRES